MKRNNIRKILVLLLSATMAIHPVPITAGNAVRIANGSVSSETEFCLDGRRAADGQGAYLTWSRIEGASYYKLFQDDTELSGTISNPAAGEIVDYTVTTGLEEGHAAYSFVVKAYDSADQEIAASNTKKVAIVKKNEISDGSNLYPSYQRKVPFSDLALNMDFIGPSITDPNYHYWCTSVTYAEEDQKYHMFTSRVPASLGFEKGWSTDCEIAHFVADTPEGPFKEVETVFDNAYFKEKYSSLAVNASPHNSRISRIDGKYCMTFMIQMKNPNAGGANEHATVLATADSVYGPWTIQDNGTGTGYTIPPYGNGQRNIANNADILKVGNKYHIYFKSSASGYSQFYVAISDKLEGPYEVQPEPVTNNTQSTEDLEAFEWNGKYYLLADDNHGCVTGIAAAGILYQSRDGIHFDTADALIGFADLDEYIGLPTGATQSYGAGSSSNEYGKHERPCILMIDGKPAYFYAPSGININGDKACMTYVYKIKDLPRYKASIDPDITNGTLELTVQENQATVSADNGVLQTQDVAVAFQPDDGCVPVPESLAVTDQDGNPVKVTEDLKFSMPRGGVTVTAAFVDPKNITVNEITVDPSEKVVYLGEQQDFTAKIDGSGEGEYFKSITWEVLGGTSSDTAIDANGCLKIAENEGAGTLTVRAKSIYDPEKYGEAVVTVKKRPRVIVPESIEAGSTFVSGADPLLVRPEYVISFEGFTKQPVENPARAMYLVPNHVWHTAKLPDTNKSEAAWLVMDLGKETAVDKIWIWNLNKSGGANHAEHLRDAKYVDIYVSADKENWQKIEGDQPDGSHLLPQGTMDVANPYSYCGEIGTDTRYVKVQILESYGDQSYWGLGKILFTESEIPAAGITIDPDEVHLETGGQATLTATIEPADATDKRVTWSSDNQDAAIVDKDGTVTAVGEGEATITVTTADGKTTAACKVIVSKSELDKLNESLEKALEEARKKDEEIKAAELARQEAEENFRKAQEEAQKKDEEIQAAKDAGKLTGEKLAAEEKARLEAEKRVKAAETALKEAKARETTAQKAVDAVKTLLQQSLGVEDVSLKNASYNKITISWDKQSAASGYEIYRSVNRNDTYTKIKDINKTNTVRYTDSKLVSNKVYFYRVRAYKNTEFGKIYGDYSAAAKLKAVPAQAVISASTGNKTATIKAKKQTSVSGYEIYRATRKSGSYKKIKEIKSGASLTYKDKKLKPGKTYYYKARTYKTVKGKKIYGAYSVIQKVKIK